jgi:hypothetical protein
LGEKAGGIVFCFFVRETNGGTILWIVDFRLLIADWKDDNSIIRGFDDSSMEVQGIGGMREGEG